MKAILKSYIGDKKFYRTILLIVAPIMVQQLFFSLAGYVDNIMINAYGGDGYVEAYNGVSAANRLLFIINFTALGLCAASGIFISQFFGAKSNEKINEALRLAVYAAILFGLIAFFTIMFVGKPIVNGFLVSEEARAFGYDYLDVIKWGMVFTVLSMTFANSFRSVQQSVLPMIAGICGIAVNVFFNYLLIFGKFGFPCLAAKGAAIATVLSRGVELLILVFYAAFSKKSLFRGAFKTFKVSRTLTAQFVKKGTPIVLNEVFWSFGTVLFALFYTYHNDFWYNAYAYAQNISDLFFIIFAGLGSGTSIIVGTHLGAGNFEEAKLAAKRMKGLGIMTGLGVGAIMAITAPYVSLLFKPNAETLRLTSVVLRITAAFLVLYSYNVVNFFILRSGGDTTRTLILDQVPTYLVGIPVAALLGLNASAWHLTLPIIFTVTHISDIVKIFIGNSFINKGKWIVNLAEKSSDLPLENSSLAPSQADSE